MAFEQIRMDRPLSRLELGIVIIIIALCFYWLFDRMNRMAAAAEATALDLTVRSLRSGVMAAAATRLLQGEYAELAQLAEGNPVGIAIDPPPGYIGAVSAANPASIQPGQWYFDADNRWLVYHLVNTDYLSGSVEGPPRVRMQLRLVYDDKDDDGAFDADSERFEGIRVELLDQPAWSY